jgi:hypothetical protein
MEMNNGFGESIKMLDDKPFFRLLTEARKRLQAILVESKIPEKSLNVVRNCVDQVSMLKNFFPSSLITWLNKGFALGNPFQLGLRI